MNHANQTAAHRPFAAVYANAAARTAATGFARGEGGTIIAFAAADLYKEVLQLDNDTTWMLTDESPITWVQSAGPGLAPAAHATSHQNGGSDEISVTGLSGLLADPQTPATHTHSSADVTDFNEAVEDRIGAKVVAGSGISVSYNDATGETQITNADPGTGAGLSTEDVQDIVGGLIVEGVGIDVNYNDGANTLTITNTDPGSGVTSGATIGLIQMIRTANYSM